MYTPIHAAPDTLELYKEMFTALVGIGAATTITTVVAVITGAVCVTLGVLL